MANGVQAGSSVAAGLEGLVGGFLMGADFRRQRAFDKEDAEERRRLRERQQMLDRQAAEDRARVHAVQDLSLATEHGLAFGPRPKMSVEDLRRGTGEALKTFSGLEVPGARAEFVEGTERRAELGIPEAPEGFHRVGPSAAERESGRLTRLREGVGGFLSADPEERSRMFSDPDIVAGLAELGILDDAAGPVLEPPETATDPAPVNWQVQETEDGLVQVHPRTGEVRPLSLGGESLQRPPPDRVPRRPTEAQSRAQVALARAQPALARLESFIEENEGTVPVTSVRRHIPGIGGRFAAPEDVQEYQQAAELIASAILRVESGAAITKDEVESYQRQFIPQEGDKPEVVQRKLETIRATLDAIASVSGADLVTPGGGSSGPVSFEDLIPR